MLVIEGMYFRQSGSVADISLHESGIDPLVFDTERGGFSVHIELRSNTGGEHALVSQVSTVTMPPAPVRAAFARLLENRLPEGHEPITSESKNVDADGNIEEGYVVALSLMPEPFRAFDRQLAVAFGDALASATGLLRWRSRTFGASRPLSSRPREWSFDGEAWHMMPTDTGAQLIDSAHVEVSARAADELQAMLDRGESEPLAHDLLREAWSNRRANPASSLLIGMAALEIGLKQYISACVPDATWLAENAPTPPVVRILREYLPTLPPVAGGHAVATFENEIFDTLRGAVSKRNDLAHKGATVGAGQLDKTLRTIRDVLWSLDDARGYAWAADYKYGLDSDPPGSLRQI
jgi:hypothetical protein